MTFQPARAKFGRRIELRGVLDVHPGIDVGQYAKFCNSLARDEFREHRRRSFDVGLAAANAQSFTGDPASLLMGKPGIFA